MTVYIVFERFCYSAPRTDFDKTTVDTRRVLKVFDSNDKALTFVTNYLPDYSISLEDEREKLAREWENLSDDIIEFANLTFEKYVKANANYITNIYPENPFDWPNAIKGVDVHRCDFAFDATYYYGIEEREVE